MINDTPLSFHQTRLNYHPIFELYICISLKFSGLGNMLTLLAHFLPRHPKGFGILHERKSVPQYQWNRNAQGLFLARKGSQSAQGNHMNHMMTYNVDGHHFFRWH